MNEQQKQQWLSILERTNIDKRHYDKVVNYLDMYVVNETLYGHMSESISKADYENLDEKIIPLSLKIFGMIDLDKVDFIGYPMDLDTWMIEVTDDGKLDTHIVNEISQIINNKLNNGFRATIFKVLQSILEKDNKAEVWSRIKFYN